MKRNGKHTNKPARRGSALVIVLGLLAVMIVMGIAFATFVKTEQAGSTSLKNSLVARQSLNTAVGRVMDAIDLSFAGVDNEWPVCVWPHPWLASSNEENADYYQSRTAAGRPVARIITREIADLLSPSQLALARSAEVGWAPIYASVEAGSELGKLKDESKPRQSETGRYGNMGWDGADSVVGRYAFIALETTGLLDANLVGIDQNQDGSEDDLLARAATRGEDPRLFVLPECDAEDPAGNEILNSLLSASAWADAVDEQSAGFSSFSDIRAAAAAASWEKDGTTKVRGTPGDHLALDVSAPHESGKKPPTDNERSDSWVANHYFPADLFATFAPSLEEADPDGSPKIVLPTTPAALKSIEKDSKGPRIFAARAFRAMAKAFANSRFDSEKTSGAGTDDHYVIFAGAGSGTEYNLSRARLATVAMIDAMDEDRTPGKWVAASYEPWRMLPNFGGSRAFDASVVSATGGEDVLEIEDDISDLKSTVRADPLNFPCTEPVPMLSRVFAYVDFDPDDVDWNCIDPANGNPEDSTVTFHGTIRVGAVAGLLNVSTNGFKENNTFTLDVQCDALFANPSGNTVASVKNATEADVAKAIVGKGGGAGGDPGGDPGGGGGGGDPDVHRVWSSSLLTFDPESAAKVQAVSLDEGSGSGSLDDIVGSSSLMLEVRKDIPFTVTCRCAAWPEDDPSDPGYDPANPSYETVDPGIPGQIFHESSGGGGGSGDPGDPGDPGNPGGGGGGGSYKYYFYPATQAEEDGAEDLFLPFRFKATIKNGNTTVQQVPAPALESANADRGYWLCVRAGLFHKPGATASGVKTENIERGGKRLDPWNRFYAPGWAMSVDPAFAFDTTCLVGGMGGTSVGQPASCGFWLNDAAARNMKEAKGWAHMTRLLEKLDNEKIKETDGYNMLIDADATDPGASRFNYLQQKWIFDVDSKFAPWTDWIAPGPKTMPDVLHAYKGGNGFGGCTPFCMNRNGSLSDSKAQHGLLTHVQNLPFRSVGELGNVMCGPFETVSTVRSYRFGSTRTDIHRVLDYFTTGEDRYPRASEYNGKGSVDVDSQTGDADFSRCSDPVDPGVHAGRVNLNMPPIVRWTDKDARRARQAYRNGELFNPFPVMAALTGTQLFSPYRVDVGVGTLVPMDEDTACSIATSLANHGGTEVFNEFVYHTDAWHHDETLGGIWKSGEHYFEGEVVKVVDGDFTGYFHCESEHDSNDDNKPTRSTYWSECWKRLSKRVKTRLSDIGVAEQNGENPILHAVVDALKNAEIDKNLEENLQIDADREAFIANSSNAFTTRGQTFLVIIRADAYTPRYGEETAEDGEGTTLATTHAVLELFRDPRYARYPDGSPLRKNPKQAVGSNNPEYYFHNWYIKSMRVF